MSISAKTFSFGNAMHELGPCLREMHSFSIVVVVNHLYFLLYGKNLLQMVKRNLRCPHQPQPDIRPLVQVC